MPTFRGGQIGKQGTYVWAHSPTSIPLPTKLKERGEMKKNPSKNVCILAHKTVSFSELTRLRLEPQMDVVYLFIFKLRRDKRVADKQVMCLLNPFCRPLGDPGKLPPPSLSANKPWFPSAGRTPEDFSRQARSPEAGKVGRGQGGGLVTEQMAGGADRKLKREGDSEAKEAGRSHGQALRVQLRRSHLDKQT